MGIGGNKIRTSNNSIADSNNASMFRRLKVESIGTQLSSQTAKMNKEVVKYKESEDAYAIVKRQIEHYDEQNAALMKKLEAIHQNYRGEKKMVNDLFNLADKEKSLAIDEDTRYYGLKSQFEKK